MNILHGKPKVVVAWLDGVYRTHSGISVPVPREALDEAHKEVLELDSIMMYAQVVIASSITIDGMPVVWLNPDEANLPWPLVRKVELVLRRYIRNTLLRHSPERRKPDKRDVLIPSLPYDPDGLMSIP